MSEAKKRKKGKLFEKESKRVLRRNWEAILGAGISLYSKWKLWEAIRRAMVRAYHKGEKDQSARIGHAMRSRQWEEGAAEK